MTQYVLIVAGGKGIRMGGDIPKQFLPIGGVPVLMRTMDAFYAYNQDIQIILVLPHDQQAFWLDLCRKHHFERPYRIADGGETRFHSVKNGLALVETPALVGVHDGVRPFVSSDVIRRCYAEASQKHAVVPCVNVVETLRHVQEERSVTVPRDEYRLVQTPQVFDATLLKKAYEQPYSPQFTDDASVVESMGMVVSLIEGNRENIKITTKQDLMLAEEIICRRKRG